MQMITVSPSNDDQEKGMILDAHDVEIQCPAAIGKNGLVSHDEKREGDGMTPCGIWPVRKIYYRPDRITLPSCNLEVIPITPEMGWCDDPKHARYNQEVHLPFPVSHEVMWRDDHAYDIVIPLGYNDAPPVPEKGSAIFFHLLHEGKRFTEGCIAINREAMLAILPEITLETMVRITASAPRR